MIRHLLQLLGLGPRSLPTHPPVESRDDWLHDLLDELRQPAYERGFERADWDAIQQMADSGALDQFAAIRQKWDAG